MITFDNSLNWGAILNAAVLFVGFVVAFTRIGGRIDVLAIRIAAVEELLTESKTYDRRITTLEERVTNQASRIDEIKREGRHAA